MTEIRKEWLAEQRRRWMRPDAERWIRPDAYRFMAPGAPRLLGKKAVEYFWPHPSPTRPEPNWERKYSVDQPRAPAGQRDGGQWVRAAALAGEVSSAGPRVRSAVEFVAANRRSEAYCWNQMQIDMLYCSTLYPPSRVAICRAQANERYAACLVGRPIPPLPF